MVEAKLFSLRFQPGSDMPALATKPSSLHACMSPRANSQMPLFACFELVMANSGSRHGGLIRTLTQHWKSKSYGCLVPSLLLAPTAAQ